MHLADGDDQRLERRNVAADQNLQGHDQLGRNDDGVDALVRHGAVRAHAVDVDAEPVGVGHALAGGGRDLACFDFAPDMHAEHAVDTIERACVDHHAGTDGNFLGGLEEDTHLAMNLIAHLHENTRGAEHHRDMAVMAACMHDARVFGFVRKVGALDHRKGIDIGAKRDASTRRPFCIVGVIGGSCDCGDNARLGDALVRNAHARKPRANGSRRTYLLAGKFGVRVKITTVGDDGIFRRCRDFLDTLGNLTFDCHDACSFAARIA